MREMVLNHASLRVFDPHTAVAWLKGMAAGMLVLVNDGVAQETLVMSQSIYETNYLTNRSSWNDLDEVLQGLRRSGARDERDFIMDLLFNKGRSLSDIGRLRDCKATTLPPEDGKPLVLCAITDGIAVGFPSDGWERDQLTISFNETLIDDDGNIVEKSKTKTIDNLTLRTHARTICRRHHQRQRDARRRCRKGTELWEVREIAFPNLVFGPDVEGHIAKLGGTDLRMLVEKLAMLNVLTAQWRNNRAPAPSGWKVAGVRDESATVKRDPTLREERRFRPRRGPRQLFFLHTDFRVGKRIHFRYDDSHFPHKREVEIGYIGEKLPTAMFRN